MTMIYYYIKYRSEATPVGTIVAHPRDDIGMFAAGYLPCLGHVVAIKKYPELFRMIGHNYAQTPKQLTLFEAAVSKLGIKRFRHKEEDINKSEFFKLPGAVPFDRNEHWESVETTNRNSISRSTE